MIGFKPFIDPEVIKERAEFLAESDRNTIRHLKKLSSTFQGYIEEMLATGKLKGHNSFVNTVSVLEKTIDSLEARLLRESETTSEGPVIFWSDEMTESFMRRFLGECPVSFPE